MRIYQGLRIRKLIHSYWVQREMYVLGIKKKTATTDAVGLFLVKFYELYLREKH